MLRDVLDRKRSAARAGASAGLSSVARPSLCRVEEPLLAWYREHGRDLPWRKMRDAYAILVSEVMAQQYRVENVDMPAVRAFSA